MSMAAAGRAPLGDPLAPSKPRHNLPARTTAFIGRTAEMGRLTELIHDPTVRLITVLAPGGMGKTCLALEAGHRQVDQFSDGVYLVTLQPDSSADTLTLAIARETGYQFRPSEQDKRSQLLDFLRPLRLLLILDNGEYLADDAEFLSAIIQTAPQVQILATSRRKLNQSAETTLQLRGLDFPGDDSPLNALDYDAVQYFIQGARRVRPDYTPAGETLESIVEICRLTQGMPLALLLASGWVTVLTAAEIIIEIQSCIDILQTDLGDVPPRQRSIRAVFDYSWRLLSPEEQWVFARLSVLRNGFSREAAKDVAGADLPMLMSLTSKSLIQRQPDSGRFYAHELLRQYAAEHLVHSGEAAKIRAAHGAYFLQYLAQMEPELKGQSQLSALNSIEADFDDALLAWEWAVKQEQFDLLAAALEGFFWYAMMRNRYESAEAIFDMTTSGSTRQSNREVHLLRERVRLRQWWLRRWREGSFAHQTDILDELETTLTRLQRFDAPHDVAICYLLLGDATRYLTDDIKQAIAYLSTSYAAFQKLNDDFYAAWALHFRARAERDQHGIVNSAEILRQALELRRRRQDSISTIYSLYNLSTDLLLMGQLDEGEQTASEMLDLSRTMGEYSGILMAQTTLSLTAFLRGQFERAADLTQINVRLAMELNHLLGRTHTLIIQALLAYHQGDQAAAAALLTESDEQATQDFVQYLVDWALTLTGVPDIPANRLVRALDYAASIGARGAMIWCLPACALLDAQRGEWSRAAALLTLVDHLMEGADSWIARWHDLTQLRAELDRRSVDDDEFDETGEQFSTDVTATVGALLNIYGHNNADHMPFSPFVQQANQQLVEPLSTREIEVLQLVVTGLSNREIAEQLYVQISTVKKHTSNIYGKLGVSRRSQAIRRAQEIGLVE